MASGTEPTMVSRDSLFTCKWFEVVSEIWRRANGAEFTVIYPRRRDASMVLITSGEGESRSVLLVRQFRPTHERWSVELVVGISESGESPEQTAAREAEEETGLIVGSVQKLCFFTPTPGYNNEKTHIFVAQVIGEGKMNPDLSETFEGTFWVTLKEAKRLIVKGEITCPTTIAALSVFELTVLELSES